jgi:hypothetical protein
MSKIEQYITQSFHSFITCLKDNNFRSSAIINHEELDSRIEEKMIPMYNKEEKLDLDSPRTMKEN